MRLKVLLPSEIFIDQEVDQVVAEAENGSFCLLPRHVDFVAAMVPGILSFTAGAAGEQFVAIDEGILIKCGPEVLVSTRNAVRGPDLGSLKVEVENQFLAAADREKLSRSALARLEAGGLRLRVARIDMTAIAKMVTGNAFPAATAKKVELSFSTSGDPVQVYGDVHRLEIVLTNLVGNALKFTPPGGRIDVRVSHSAEGVSVEVADTGIGIPKEQQEPEFERFLRYVAGSGLEPAQLDAVLGGNAARLFGLDRSEG